MSLLDLYRAATLLNRGDWPDVAQWLWRSYIDNAGEKARQADAAERVDYYEDRAHARVVSLICTLYEHRQVRRKLSGFVSTALSNNVTKRLISEKSTVYVEPAKRTIPDADGGENFAALSEALSLDTRMRQMNHYTNLCNETLLWPYVLNGPTGKVACLEVLTPDLFWVVAHPNYPKLPVAFIIEQIPAGSNRLPELPHYLVLTATEFFRLNKKGRIVGEVIPHPYERIPAVLVHAEAPMSGLLNASKGGDIIAAHRSVALLNTLMLAQQKSGGKAAYITTSQAQNIGRGQPFDPEYPILLPADTTVSTVDTGTPPDAILAEINHTLKSVAGAHGIPLKLIDAEWESADRADAMRYALRERRKENIAYCRSAEHELADVLARIVAVDLPERAFDPGQLVVNFGELETPRDPAADFALFEKLASMGLTDVIEYKRKLDPDLSFEQATARIKESLAIQTAVLDVITKRNAPLNAKVGEVHTPAANGATAANDDDALVRQILEVA